LDHPNILQFYGFIEDDERFQPYGAFVSPVSSSFDLLHDCIVTGSQWCQRGDLIKFLEDNPSAELEDRFKIVSINASSFPILKGESVEGRCGGCQLLTWLHTSHHSRRSEASKAIIKIYRDATLIQFFSGKLPNRRQR
jgi:hypothetical protein